MKRQSAIAAGYALTDCGNAERLLDQHGESIRFCPEKRSWFAWSGKRWDSDRGAVIQLAKKSIRAMHVERNQLLRLAENYPESEEIFQKQAAVLSKWANVSEGIGRITAMVNLASTDPRVIIRPEAFDKDPWLLNVRNGTLELRTGRLREHRPTELVTKMAGTKYDANAPCDRWKRFLEEVFEPHPDIIPFIQRVIGYTLTGDTREECVFVLLGKGRNGKSTLISVMHQLLGSYGGVAEVETFLAAQGGHLREDIADMRGRRFISAQEPAVKGSFAENTLKWLSGGDRLRARRLYEHAEEFQPSHKLWLAVNRMPTLRQDDKAAWNRLKIIPFDVSFVTHINRDLKHELLNELSGILRWAVHGCVEWQKVGLGETQSVEEARRFHWRAGGQIAA